MRRPADFFKHLDHSLASVLPSGSWKIFWLERTKTVIQSVEELLLHAWVYLWQQIGRLSGEQLDYRRTFFPEVSCLSDEPDQESILMLFAEWAGGLRKTPKPTRRPQSYKVFSPVASFWAVLVFQGCLATLTPCSGQGWSAFGQRAWDVGRGWFLIKNVCWIHVSNNFSLQMPHPEPWLASPTFFFLFVLMSLL